MRSIIFLLAFIPALCATESNWYNVNRDGSWQVTQSESQTNVVRSTNARSTSVEYRENGNGRINREVKVSYDFVVLGQERASDGKGVWITDGVGNRWFVSMDDGEGEYLIYDVTAGKPLASDKTHIIAIGQNHKVSVSIETDQIQLSSSGENGEVNISHAVQLVLPVTIKLHCQRSGAEFNNITVGDIVEEIEPRSFARSLPVPMALVVAAVPEPEVLEVVAAVPEPEVTVAHCDHTCKCDCDTSGITAKLETIEQAIGINQEQNATNQKDVNARLDRIEQLLLLVIENQNATRSGNQCNYNPDGSSKDSGYSTYEGYTYGQQGDNNNGHGNDADGVDESNPGKSNKNQNNNNKECGCNQFQF